MSRDALPCIVCGKALRNVTDDSSNQPNDGTAFQTEGHYGSTVFDPMDGTVLEVNLCDPCLLAAAEQGRVFWSRSYKLVECMGMVVGREWLHGEQVPWDPDVERNARSEPALEVEIEEIGTDLGKIEWRPRISETISLLKRARALKEGE